MTDLERDLRAGLAADDGLDAEFVASMRLALDARPLADDAPVTLPPEAASRLVRLAELALDRAQIDRTLARALADTAARGQLVAAVAGDERNRLIAEIEFDDEDQLRLAAQSLAGDVLVVPAPPAIEAANDEAA